MKTVACINSAGYIHSSKDLNVTLNNVTPNNVTLNNVISLNNTVRCYTQQYGTMVHSTPVVAGAGVAVQSESMSETRTAGAGQWQGGGRRTKEFG